MSRFGDTARRPDETDSRADARERFRTRRQQPDRRLAERPPPVERREADRRTGVDRRDEPANEYSREEFHRIRGLIATAENRRLLTHGQRLSCPRCHGTLRLQPPTRWSSTETVWEVRCSGCRRHVIYREQTA